MKTPSLYHLMTPDAACLFVFNELRVNVDGPPYVVTSFWSPEAPKKKVRVT